MANWLRLPSGRLCNLDLFADIDSDIASTRPWARATLAAGASVGPDYDAECQPVTISYGGADARALMQHFATQEVVRAAPLASSPTLPDPDIMAQLDGEERATAEFHRERRASEGGRGEQHARDDVPF